MDQTKLFEDVRRKNELERYGKLVSLRPTKVQKSKKLYSRKKKHKGEQYK